MKEIEKERVIVIGSQTEQGFQDAINDALDQNENARIQDVDLAHLRAWIRYVEVYRKAETKRDEYTLRGIHPKCGSCPYYEPPTD